MNFKKVLTFIESLIIVCSFSSYLSVFAQSENICMDENNHETQKTSLTAPVCTAAEDCEDPAQNEDNNETTPKVSIIIPVYNSEKYLDECLKSVINQTLKEIEIICVNDGSKDNSLEILKKYQEKDPRIVVIDKKNAGVSAARNDGMNAARGEYIEFLDSDDRIDKETCETAYNMIKDKDADILCFGWRNFTDNGESTSRKDCTLERELFDNWLEAKKKRASMICWNKLYKKSMLQENNLTFNPDIKIAEDECFNLCVYPFAKRIVHIPITFYNYRVNLSSATKTMSFKFMLTNYIKVWKFVDDFYKQHDIQFNVLSRFFYLKIYKEDFWPLLLPTLKN